MDDRLILVNEIDEVLGISEKIDAHRDGLLHRAISVFVINSRGELLLQKRAPTKYHSPGLWSNSCCGHPRPGEESLAAALRRLEVEMGLDCTLTEIGSFIYSCGVGNGFIEHEYDHVFIGESDQSPLVNPDEVADWRWLDFGSLEKELNFYPERYTLWLKEIVPSHLTSFTKPYRWR